MLEQFRDYQKALQVFEREIAHLRAATVTREVFLTTAKQIVDDYFRDIRVQILTSGISEEELPKIDALVQRLLDATRRRTPTSTFKKTVKDLRKECFEIDKRLLANAGAIRAATSGDAVDVLIVNSLKSLVPSAALAYEQGLIDLSSGNRISWRGPATDFREALRETLDHLAPDAQVTQQPGYKPETNTNGPTMKQKVRYILRQRSKAKMIVDSTEAAVESVDAVLGTFVRSVYTRSSVSTHTPTDRDEVIRVRDFVKLALCELLEIRVA